MTVSSANRATRELHMALAMAALRGEITDFRSRASEGCVQTLVYIPDATDLETLAHVKEVCLTAFDDIFRTYEIHPDTRRPWTNYNRKLGFAFERPLTGWSICTNGPCVSCPHHPNHWDVSRRTDKEE